MPKVNFRKIHEDGTIKYIFDEPIVLYGERELVFIYRLNDDYNIIGLKEVIIDE